MTGMCGWIGGGVASADARGLNKRIISTLHCGPADPEITRFEAGDGGALMLAGSTAESHFFTDGTLFAALIGFPDWNTPEFADIAARDGHARALVEAYRRLDRKMFDVVGGAALAVMDFDRNCAVVALDRLATRTMCYARSSDGSLVFGSTADSVRCYPGVAATLNSQAVFDYLFFTRVPCPETIYLEQQKLLPAQYLWYQDGRVDIERYWEVPYEVRTSKNIEALSEQLRENTRSAVKKSMDGRELGKVGAFLSGGLDSSTVLTLMADGAPEPVDAFTIGFDEAGYDEMHYAHMAAQHVGAHHHEYYVTPQDIVDLAPRIAEVYDEPFGNSSAVPAFYCAHMAAENGIDLLLAGDGGDELFAGNTRYARQKLLGAYQAVPGWLRRGVIEPCAFAFPCGDSIMPMRKIRSYIRQANVPLPDRMEETNFQFGRNPAQVFLPEFAAQVDEGHPLAIMNEVFHRTRSPSTLQRMLHLDLQLTLGDDDLRKVGRMCELAGVEVAYPLLDENVVAFAAQVPPQMCLKGLRLRYFYRQAFREILSDTTLSKPKQGFGLPVGQWLRTYQPLKEMALDSISALKQRGIFRSGFLDEVIDLHRDGHASFHGEQVWILMILELWLRAHRTT